MKGKMISSAIICKDMEQVWDITGATIELKKSEIHLKSRSTTFVQLCANMIRVSGFLAERHCVRGVW